MAVWTNYSDFSDGFLVGAGTGIVIVLLAWILVTLLQKEEPETEEEELAALEARVNAQTAKLRKASADVSGATGAIANIEPTTTTEGQ